jgi:hypothetical protein
LHASSSILSDLHKSNPNESASMVLDLNVSALCMKEVQVHEHQALTLWEMIVVVDCLVFKELRKNG